MRFSRMSNSELCERGAGECLKLLEFICSWYGVYSAILIAGLPIFFMGCNYPPNRRQNYQCYSAKYQEVLAYKTEIFSESSKRGTTYFIKASYYTNEHYQLLSSQ